MEELTIPKVLQQIKEKYPNRPAQYSKDPQGAFRQVTYAELFEQVKNFGAGLLSIGVKRDDHIGLISDNRQEWFVADLAILSIGAADVPRGCDSLAGEIRYILDFADCKTALVENEAQLDKVLQHKQEIPQLKKIIVIDPSFTKDSSLLETFKQVLQGVSIYSFSEIMEQGKQYNDDNPETFENKIAEGTEKDCATIIFTSGTTGEPKGVMLHHLAFLNQAMNVPKLITLTPEDIWLSVLPVWHSFERIMQYVSLTAGSALAYSKPIGKIMLQDFESIRPTWMASVPRIWSSLRAGIYRNINSEGGIKKVLFHFFVAAGSAHAGLGYRLKGLLPEFRRRFRLGDILIAIIPYLLLAPLKALGNTLVFKKIKAKLGGRFVAGISGGGALPVTDDKFFAAVGVLLLEGYGLTETAPVLGVRKQAHPVFGTVGPVFPNMEVKIVDEQGNTLPPGQKGVIYARGPQVMIGYYKKPEETEKVIDAEGWFNTGDLGMLTHNNELKIVGRAKDTIVLLGGENVEPAPIEEKLQDSPFIERAMVVGQDKKFLAALVLPNLDNVEEYAKENNISYINREELAESHEIIELLNRAIQELISTKNGFKPYEQIFRFKVITKEFELGKELSQKQEIKRHVISEMYRREIRELYAQR